MYACVRGKKPFLAGGNPFRPAINTVIRLDLPYNPHLIGDTQLLIYNLYLILVTTIQTAVVFLFRACVPNIDDDDFIRSSHAFCLFRVLGQL